MVMAWCARRNPGCRFGNDPPPDPIPIACLCYPRPRAIHRFRHRHGRPSNVANKGWTRKRVPQSWYLGYWTEWKQQPLRILGVLGLSILPNHYRRWIRLLVPKGAVV